MASIKFIVEDDEPVALTCSGSTFDIAALVTYLIGSIYRMMRGRNAAIGEQFKKMMCAAVAGPGSPTWNIQQAEGEMDIAILMPNGKSDDDGGIDND